MASTRKSRNPNKRFSKLNEESPDKDGGGIRSKNRKRKLSDMLGPQWSKEELERFYEAYRKYGKDWKKVAGVIRNRTVDMVEALYNMNKAYLSLADGMATAAGLIAMMTDHYNILEGSDSDRESNHGIRTSIKPQKRGRGKIRLSLGKGKSGSYPDLLQHQPASSSYGCLSLLNKKRSGVGKLSQFMDKPTKQHWNAAMQVLRYMKKVLGRGILFQKGTFMSIVGYFDVDYVGCMADRKSTTGICTYVTCNLVTWRSKK